MIKVKDYEEILEPYNDREFIGEFSARALRFDLSAEGKPEKVVILTIRDEIIELEFIE